MDAPDEPDLVLLRLLRRNARATIAELAVELGLAPSSVHERIRRLERRGVIRRWTVEIDPAAVGIPVTAFVGVEADVAGADLAVALDRLEGIDECHSVAGGLSLLLKVRAADTEGLLRLVEDVRRLPGVRRIETSVVLRTQFEHGPEPRNGHLTCGGRFLSRPA
jgi:DNA-binding Lrp family transcriptional regulator